MGREALEAVGVVFWGYLSRQRSAPSRGPARQGAHSGIEGDPIDASGLA